jgi:hypothetical protein
VTLVAGLELRASCIYVAEYLTGLPDGKLLQHKLHAAVELSRAMFEARQRVRNEDGAGSGGLGDDLHFA